MGRLVDADKITKDALVGFVGDQGAISFDDLLWMVSELPAVDAVPVKRGRWIMRGGKRYCSVCQQMACVTRDRDDFWYTAGTNYCPNCGAKMDKEKEHGE